MDIQEIEDNESVTSLTPEQRLKCKPKGIDIAEILDLRSKNLSQSEIAKVLGITQQTVNKRLKSFLPLYKRLDTFKNHRADLFTLKQAELLEAITPDKLDKANISQVATALGIIYDKERLERGQSTSNVEIHAEVIQASERLRLLRIMVDGGVGGEGEVVEKESKVTSPTENLKTKVSP